MNLNWLKSGGNPLKEMRKHEPGVTSLALENHWKQARDVMVEARDPESAITVISHFNQMISFLRISRDDPPSWSKCKEFWIRNRCSDQAIKWLHDLGAQRCDKDDLKLVNTLQSLLELASEEGQLLGYVISQSTSSSSGHSNVGDVAWDSVCSLSTILLELCISVDTRISAAARKSFVLLIQLASKYPELETSISQEARVGVTNMTISGLSACFAQLPTFQTASSDQLQPFIQQLHFVDSVVGAATDILAAKIADCFSKNFLHAVILPALTQDEGSRSLHTRDDQIDYVRSVHEEIAVVTSYLQIVCENISHSLLVKSLITFVLNQMLTTLLHRMNHPSTAVTVATLSLLNVLLEFYCEDLWYETILRYLMTQNHLMVSQRYNRLPEVDFQDAALRFISLLPTSVTDVLGPETVSFNFMQYVNGEVVRWCAIDGISYPQDEKEPNVTVNMNDSREAVSTSASANVYGTTTTSSCSASIEGAEAAESTNKSSISPDEIPSNWANPIYPLWKHKYDGTDKLDGSSAPRSLINYRSNCNNNSSGSKSPKEGEPPVDIQNTDDMSVTLAKVKAEEEQTAAMDPLSAAEKFTTVSLHGGTNMSDELNSIGIGMSETSFDSELTASSSNLISSKRLDVSANDASDGYSSMESGTMQDNVASFGPFVDCLFNHLANFAKLDPDVILMVTELISTLAASRIPLISSLFLDHNLTLQPSFRSFLLIVNRIRLELDKCVRNQQAVITEVWAQLTREQTRLEQESNRAMSSQNSISALNDSGTFAPFGEHFTDNLRSKINSNALVAAVSAVFHRKAVPVAPSATENHAETTPPQSDLLQSLGQHGYRLVTGRPGSAEQARRPSTQVQDPLTKMMVTRAIFFTHWLLELSAIATQLCWKR